MDYRWSIVTAYKGNTINYKCALNVFKPVNMEFNIPVTQEQFDLEHYMKMYGQDYTLYNKQYTTLESQRDLQLEVLANEQEPSDDEMAKLIEIFNVDATEENLSVVYSLLKK
jgi:hypothetical protein